MPSADPSRFHGLLAIAAFVLIAWLCSTARRRVNLRLVATGLLLQAAIAIVLLRIPATADAFDVVAGFVAKAISFADEGSRFVFGSLADPAGPWGFVFAFRVIPVIIFFAALMAMLYQLRVMPLVVAGMAWCLKRTLGVTATEALATASNVVIGQTEAPLCVRPYLPSMTRSQLMVVMTGGFATIAGGVFALYVGFGIEPGHLMVASVMAVPAGLVCSKLLWPENEQSETLGKVVLSNEKSASNVVEAAANGAIDGLKLALNVGAMLVAFLGLMAVANWLLGHVGDWIAVERWLLEPGERLSLDRLLGWAFSPIAAVMGVQADEISTLGQLLGKKIVLNELVAYQDLGAMKAELSERTVRIASFALCGFANIGSVAIQIGGLGAMAPERKSEFAKLAFRAMFAGAIATCMTACLAGVLA